jgi:MFS family permease
VLLVLAMVLVMSTLAFNFNVLLPVLAKATLHQGPSTFGIISASFGAGALVGALLSAALGRASWRVFLTASAGLGLSELLLAPQQSLAGVCLMLFAMGVCFTLWTSTANSTLQLGAPDNLRGRVVGLYFYAFNGAAPLGGLLVGWLCARGGTELSLLVAGVAGLSLTAFAAHALRVDRVVARRLLALARS